MSRLPPKAVQDYLRQAVQEELNGETARWIVEHQAQPDLIAGFLRDLSLEQRVHLDHDWGQWGRPSQQIPTSANGAHDRWFIWLMLTGRGWGKTRTISETVHTVADQMPGAQIALVARTASDHLKVLVRGPSGIVATQKPWNPCNHVLNRSVVEWENGTIATTFSSEEPDQLRGPNHHLVIGDEVATWKKAKDDEGGTAWDNAQLGCRLRYRHPDGSQTRPRIVLATTPRPTKFVSDLVKDPRVFVTRGTILENRTNLDAAYLRSMLLKYAGTRMGKQELDGEVLDSIEDALVLMDWIEETRVVDVAEMPALVASCVAVDPPATSGEDADECGIITCGRSAAFHGYVTHDDSMQRATPREWGAKVVDRWSRVRADCVVAEVNQGGEMVKEVIQAQARDRFGRMASIPVRMVRAVVGKRLRFEPVAHLYELRRIHHVGFHPALEDQLCLFDREDYQGGDSPDRADAATYGLSHLLLKNFFEDVSTLGGQEAPDRASPWVIS